VDQYCLKRLNKQMLTWVTFPVYVALFSLLIYYIGYRLRAGGQPRRSAAAQQGI
jgi:hypothetical protein